MGMAPPTDASKFSAACLLSAIAASLTPCRASKALLAVTTDFPDASAAATAPLEGSPAPPISSTNTSMAGSRARASGSENHFIFLTSTPRSLARERGQTATTSMARPQRALNASRWCEIWEASAAPTVPNPATPTLSDGLRMTLSENRFPFFGVMRSGLRHETCLPVISDALRAERRYAIALARVRENGGHCARPGGCAARFQPTRYERSFRRIRRSQCPARPRCRPSPPAAWKTPHCRAL